MSFSVRTVNNSPIVVKDLIPYTATVNLGSTGSPFSSVNSNTVNCTNLFSVNSTIQNEIEFSLTTVNPVISLGGIGQGTDTNNKLSGLIVNNFTGANPVSNSFLFNPIGNSWNIFSGSGNTGSVAQSLGNLTLGSLTANQISLTGVSQSSSVSLNSSGNLIPTFPAIIQPNNYRIQNVYTQSFSVTTGTFFTCPTGNKAVMLSCNLYNFKNSGGSLTSQSVYYIFASGPFSSGRHMFLSNQSSLGVGTGSTYNFVSTLGVLNSVVLNQGDQIALSSTTGYNIMASFMVFDQNFPLNTYIIQCPASGTQYFLFTGTRPASYGITNAIPFQIGPAVINLVSVTGALGTPGPIMITQPAGSSQFINNLASNIINLTSFPIGSTVLQGDSLIIQPQTSSNYLYSFITMYEP